MNSAGGLHMVQNQTAFVKQKAGDGHGAKNFHERRRYGLGAHPTQTDPEQSARSVLELFDFKRLHGEGLNDANAREGLLQDVVQLPHLVLAAAAGSANVTSEFRRGKNHQWNQDHGDERQPPIIIKERPQQEHQAERLLQHVRRRLRNGKLNALDVAGDRRHQAARGVPGEEGDGLLDQLGIEKIAKVAHHRVADIIDEIGGKEFRNAFGQRYANDGDCHNIPNIVDPVGKDILEVNRVMEVGYLKEDNPCSGGAGRKDLIENRLD